MDDMIKNLIVGASIAKGTKSKWWRWLVIIALILFAALAIFGSKKEERLEDILRPQAQYGEQNQDRSRGRRP